MVMANATHTSSRIKLAIPPKTNGSPVHSTESPLVRLTVQFGEAFLDSRARSFESSLDPIRQTQLLRKCTNYLGTIRRRPFKDSRLAVSIFPATESCGRRS